MLLSSNSKFDTNTSPSIIDATRTINCFIYFPVSGNFSAHSAEKAVIAVLTLPAIDEAFDPNPRIIPEIDTPSTTVATNTINCFMFYTPFKKTFG